MKKFYQGLNEIHRYTFWIIFVELMVFLLSSFCFFIHHMDISLGILLGAVISVLNFLLIIKQSDVCISTSKPKGKAVGYYILRYLLYMLRYLLYGAGLTIALLLQHFGFNIFNVFAVLGAYLLQKLTIIVYGLKKGEAE